MGQKSEQREELRKTINAMLENPVVGMSQNKMADKMGISNSSLSLWRKGKYPADTAEIDKKVERFLASYNAGENYGIELPPSPDWIETPTSLRIWNTIELAHLMKCLVVVYGAAGSGKTTTLLHYRKKRSNVYLLTAVKAACSVRGLLHMVADVLSITDEGKGNYDLHKKIIKKLSKSGGVFLVDEGQQLTPAALDTLRQIQEEAKIGMVWCGNEPLFTQLTGGFRAPKFAQIFSRIMQRTHINLCEEEDADSVAAAMGVSDPEAIKYLRGIVVLPGGLRGVVITIQRAQMAAAGSGEKEVNRQLIVESYTSLVNG